MSKSKRLNILICPDSFKGTLTAQNAAECIMKGILKSAPDASVVLNPLADGGEGSLDVINSILGGKKIRKTVYDSLGKKISSEFLILDDGTAVIESAKAIGLTLLKKKELNPMRTSTYGVGQLIGEAIKRGCKKIILFIGGSATNDAGIGIALALGVKFFDKDKKQLFRSVKDFDVREINDIGCFDLTKVDKNIINKNIKNIKTKNQKNIRNKIKIIMASDVQNPLYGKAGAAFTYAKQKGATKEMVAELDSLLRAYAIKIKKQLGKDITKKSAMGAAGGLPASLVAFFDADIVSGIDLITKLTNLEQKIRKSSLIITGEGCIDWQTISGKTIYGVLKLAKKHNKKVIAIAGQLGKGHEWLYKYEYGVSEIIDASGGRKLSWTYLMKNSQKLLVNAAERVSLLKFH